MNTGIIIELLIDGNVPFKLNVQKKRYLDKNNAKKAIEFNLKKLSNKIQEKWLSTN